MLVDVGSSVAFAPIDGFWFIVKVGLVILAVLYFIFSLIVLRQVNLMTETLITENAGLLRAFAIIHAGIALGVIVLFVGLLF